MDIVFHLGKASARDVHERMPDRPTYTAVRTMLRLLENKGLVQHQEEGRKYIYSPCSSPKTAGRSALHRVLNVFFGGSLQSAVAAHLSDPTMQLNADDLARLRTVIDEADAAQKDAAKPKSNLRPKNSG
jgi:BlaI family transcriptional regulator, penicillinase repressor